MGGTVKGGKLAAKTNKLMHGPDFYARIGAMGGRHRNRAKGFGSNRELARIVGAIGGRTSRRTKPTDFEIRSKQQVPHITQRFANLRSLL
jgi:hypothetical protein